LTMRVLLREAKLGDFDVPEVARLNGIDYWPVTWGFEVKGTDWIDEILDRGFHRRRRVGDKDGKGGTVSQSDIIDGLPEESVLVDHDEMPLADPVPFNGDGEPLKKHEDQVWISYIKFEEFNFLTLDFFSGILTAL